MIFIPISLALLAFSTGMFLLAKTRKENLSRFFKAISYLIIIASFLIICLTVIGGLKSILICRIDNLENRECMMHMQEQIAWMRGRFSLHGEIGGINSWNGMNLPPNGYERDSLENHLNDLTGRNDWEIGQQSEKLNLTSEQIKKVQEIFKNSIPQEEEKLTQTNRNNKEVFEKIMREEHQNKMEAIKKILTPIQLRLFNESNLDEM